MSTLVRWLPGLIGGLAGVVALKLVGAVTASLAIEVVTFMAVYVLVAWGLERAMRHYGSDR